MLFSSSLRRFLVALLGGAVVGASGAQAIEDARILAFPLALAR